MSFSLELAAAWARSPVKAVQNRRRTMQKGSNHNDASKHSPTRVTDFPVEEIPEDINDDMIDDEGEAINAITRNDHLAIVRQLSFAPLDIDAPQDITPIPLFQRQRPVRVKTLPTLNEDRNLEVFSPPNVSTMIKIKKKAYLPKPSRCEKVQELINEADDLAGTGDEDEALKVYEKAVRIAEAELQKLKFQLRKSLDKHPVAVPSIQTRIQQDMLELVLLQGKIKTEMIFIYERQGDYENAIDTCKEARNIYKKQKKRLPRPVYDIRSQASHESKLHSQQHISDNESISLASTKSTSKDSKSRDSKSSGDSDLSIIWYVACPNLDNFIRSNTFLYDRLSKARSSYDQRKKLMEEILMLRQEISVTVTVHERETLYCQLETMTRKVLAMEKVSLGEMHPQVADTLQLLSTIYLEQQNTKVGHREKAIQCMLQSLDINLQTLGSKHPRTGQDLLRMARLYQQTCTSLGSLASAPRKEEERAIEYFRQAATIFRGVKRGHKVVGSILNDLSVIYVARRDFETALDLLKESLSNYETEVDDDFNSSFDDVSGSLNNPCIDVVQVWRNIGECHMQRKDFTNAIEAYICALDIQRDARQKHDSVSESDDLDSISDEKSYLYHLMRMVNDDSIADTLRRLGKAFTASGKLQEGLVVYREAMQIHRSAVNDALTFARHQSNTELPGKQDQLANTLFCIAEIYATAGNADGAIRVFNESLQLRISSDSLRTENQRCNMVHCAMCLVGIANVHVKKGEHVEAHKLYSNALRFCEAQGIPFNHAIVSMIEQKRAEAEEKVIGDGNEVIRLEKRADEERQRGEYDKAITTLGEAMTLRIACTERLKAANLDTSTEVAATVKLLNSFGHIFSESGDTERAERAHKDAARLFRKSMQPKSAPEKKTVERMRVAC